MGPVTEQCEHLSSAQIENYGIRTSGAGPDAAQRDEHQRHDHRGIDDQKMDDQSVEAHLADCPSCRNRLLDFHRSFFNRASGPPEAGTPGNSVASHSSLGQRPADFTIERAKPTDSALADSKSANPKYPVVPQLRTAPSPECPSEDTLRQHAAGLVPDDLAAALTRHVADCDHCGPLFRSFTEDFSGDYTPEERAVLTNLKSGSESWQKELAKKIGKLPESDSEKDS